jgi:hypothetical protein
MKRLPWAPWKCWNRIPAASHKRQVHLGIDYGTSVSQIVFRDTGSPAGQRAVLALRNGSFRIPSRGAGIRGSVIPLNAALPHLLKRRLDREVGQPLEK